MKGLERFFIIGWMAEEEFIRDNSDKKNKSAAYLIRAHQRKIEAVVLKGRSSKKGESFRF